MAGMPNHFSISVFTQFSMSHSHAGLWRLPEAWGNRAYTDIDSWVEVARIAERGRLDAIFWADGLGSGGYRDGDLDGPLREGQYQRMDPAILIAALSRETTHLGFVMTSAMIQEHPFTFARKMSTLDHITRGRVGWNVVTSFNPGGWANLGIKQGIEHDARYDWAEEYMHVVYKLWEGSWEDDAVLHDAERGIWADPTKVHTIDHVGERYDVKGPHQVEPSPQGSPMIFQAGSSPAGRAFAARHAEMQFIGASTPAEITAHVTACAAEAASFGRDPSTLGYAPSRSFVIGSTEAEVKQKLEEYEQIISLEGIAAKMNNHFGIDFLKLDPGTKLSELTTNGIQSALDSLKASFPAGYEPTVDEILRSRATKSIIAGTPEQIADKVESIRDAGATGLLVGLPTRPGSLVDFVDHVIPILQERGVAQREYREGTLRQKLLGNGNRLSPDHPGAAYRRRMKAVP
jgi:FMN-dependent oxidoreductase (nitrilotriacetate monooxygenase family)